MAYWKRIWVPMLVLRFPTFLVINKRPVDKRTKKLDCGFRTTWQIWVFTSETRGPILLPKRFSERAASGMVTPVLQEI